MSVEVCSPCLVPVVAGCPPHRGPPEPAVPPACCCLWYPWALVEPDSDDAHMVQEKGLCTRLTIWQSNHTLQRGAATVVIQCEHLTSGGMCPLCIWPIVTCCCGAGMLPMLKLSGPPTEPERMIPGSATDPCSTLPTRLNCCCRMVDLHTFFYFGNTYSTRTLWQQL